MASPGTKRDDTAGDKRGRDIEKLLVAKMMTDAGEIALAYDELGLRPEVFIDDLCRAAFTWMLDYWQTSGKAPTWLLLAEDFPQIEPIHHVEEETQALVDVIKNRFLGQQLQNFARAAAKASTEDPLVTFDRVIEDAIAARETARLPAPPKWDRARVVYHHTEMHSRHEAKRIFDEEMALEAGPTSWEPVDLGPYLRGEVEIPRPTLGVVRSDGERFLYPGRDHTVISDTGAGKTWIADACTAAEIAAGNRVVYAHYEEADPASTIERLLLLGAAPDDIEKLLTFVGPSSPVRDEYLQALLDPAPTLVVHDGMNEAMALHGAMTKEVEGAALFRQRLLVPFLAVSAATLTCDHFPMSHDNSRLDAYGSVHKGNALSGARFALENVESFGRGLRGRSNLFVTKDRLGFLMRLGRPTKTNGKRFLGSVVIDNTPIFNQERFEFALHAPSEEGVAGLDGQEAGGPNDFLANAIYNIVAAQPNHSIASRRQLFARLRLAVAGGFTDVDSRKALDDLLYSQPPRLIEFEGARGAKGYRAVVSAS